MADGIRAFCDAAVALHEASSTAAVLAALAQHVERILGAERARARMVAQNAVPVGGEVAALLVGRSGDVWGVIEVGGYRVDEEHADRDVVLAALAAMGAAALEREARCARERETRERAEVEGRLKDELIATVSHDLRTPLQAILGWVRLLQRSPETPAQHALEVIERNAVSQASLIEDLIDASRVLSGKTTLAMRRFDLAELLRSVCEDMLPTAAARGVSVDVAGVPPSFPYVGDEGRLRRVLMNLVSNAVKFTPAKGRVELRLAAESRTAIVEVIDSGRGMSSQFMPFAFERFRQESDEGPASSGLGVGLSIVRQLVALHGGHVFAASGGAGRGSTFRVVLPVEGEPAASRPVSAPARSGPDVASVRPVLVGRRVLVVDDDADALELARIVLEEAGAEVLRASSSADALAVLVALTVDAVLTDIELPGDDGYQLLRRVRALGGGAAATPILAFTALASEVDRDRALAAGFTRHLAKSILPHQLVRAVEGVVARAG